MESIILQAQKRDLSKSSRMLREDSLIPAICYGNGKENIPVMVDYQEFKKVYMKAGENTVVKLSIDGKEVNVLIHALQIDPIYSKVNHIDFMILNMKEKVDTNVPVVISGEAPAVKELGGTLNLVLSEIAVRCLPGNIPQEFVVDISSIKDFHTAIHISDLQIPVDVEVMSDPSLTVVNVLAPAAEEEASELTPEEIEKAAIGTEEDEATESGN